MPWRRSGWKSPRLAALLFESAWLACFLKDDKGRLGPIVRDLFYVAQELPLGITGRFHLEKEKIAIGAGSKLSAMVAPVPDILGGIMQIQSAKQLATKK